MPETFESNLVNFELWLNLTGKLTENRNRLKLNSFSYGSGSIRRAYKENQRYTLMHYDQNLNDKRQYRNPRP